jgi:hypothetical protein
MSNGDYTEFDKALLSAIANGHRTMSLLDSDASGLRKLAEPHTAKLFGARVPTSRVIDRRLQALRKRGDLWFNGRYWVRLVNGAPAR